MRPYCFLKQRKRTSKIPSQIVILWNRFQNIKKFNYVGRNEKNIF